jgi:hypothetical protein
MSQMELRNRLGFLECMPVAAHTMPLQTVQQDTSGDSMARWLRLATLLSYAVAREATLPSYLGQDFARFQSTMRRSATA